MIPERSNRTTTTTTTEIYQNLENVNVTNETTMSFAERQKAFPERKK